MIPARIWLTLFLVFVPVLVCVGFGAVAIFETGYWRALWWIVPLCWGLAWLVNWLRPCLRSGHDFSETLSPLTKPRHWTDRDHQAAEIVVKHQQAFASLGPQDLSDPQHYVSVVQTMASELAKHYHGESQQHLDALSVVEVTAAARLAIDDIESFLITSFPGSRMMSIGQWKMLTRAPEWFSVISKTYWAASIALNPANLLRYGSSRVTMDPIVGQLKTETIATIYTRFVAKTGFYLIEMNSGRLRGGADAYRDHFAVPVNARPSVDTPAVNAPEIDVPQACRITVTLIGQTGAGKSSLINALRVGHVTTGDSKMAATDVLPNTRECEMFAFTIGEAGDLITLVDTPGYGESGASASQIKSIEAAMKESDLVLLVMDAHSPAKKADQQTLKTLSLYFRDHPQFKAPPIIGVLTHIDLVPPASVWSPPYDFETPTEAKEESIAGAIEYAGEIFGSDLVAITPVAITPESLADQTDRPYGVDEFLLPAMVANVEQGRSIGLLRAFENQMDLRRVRKLISQAGSLAKHAAGAWMERKR